MFVAPGKCPTCGQDLEVHEVACPSCETVVRGRWAASPFSRLTPDQQNFLTLFVRSRGNLSDVERTLGVSYPTVRAKLEEIIGALDEPAPPRSAEPPTTREEILARIARGEVSVDDGVVLLRRLARPGGAA